MKPPGSLAGGSMSADTLRQLLTFLSVNPTPRRKLDGLSTSCPTAISTGRYFCVPTGDVESPPPSSHKAFRRELGGQHTSGRRSICYIIQKLIYLVHLIFYILTYLHPGFFWPCKLLLQMIRTMVRTTLLKCFFLSLSSLSVFLMSITQHNRHSGIKNNVQLIHTIFSLHCLKMVRSEDIPSKSQNSVNTI